MSLVALQTHPQHGGVGVLGPEGMVSSHMQGIRQLRVKLATVDHLCNVKGAFIPFTLVAFPNGEDASAALHFLEEKLQGSRKIQQGIVKLPGT
jgi:hypothetical protein